MEKVMPTVASLFSGCGGLDLGFKKAGYNITWANESSKDAARSYERLIGHAVIVDDIWNQLEQIPAVDVVIGGPPCQSFSMMGKRLPDDPRGNLVFAFQKAINKLRPKAFVMENVTGLLSSKIGGEGLLSYLEGQFRNMGYTITTHKLDATDYFVPQRRKRVLLIGHRILGRKLRLLDTHEFSERIGCKNLNCPVSISEALDDLPTPSTKGCSDAVSYKCVPKSCYSQLMRNPLNNKVTLQSMPTMSKKDSEYIKHIPPGGNYRNIPDALSTARIMRIKETGGRTTCYGRLHPDRPAYTINTYFNRPNVGAHYHHFDDRLITVREALRIQSFPDSFTPYYSTQRSLHQQVGNAVPPLMAQAVALSLKDLLDE